MIEWYNQHTRNLPPLTIGDSVTIQSHVNRRWDTTGKIVECLPDRQYTIRMDGSGRVTLRNRRFLRKNNLPAQHYPIPSAYMPTSHDTESDIQSDPLPTTSNKDINTNITTGIKLPRALARLFTHNNPGTKDIAPPLSGLPAKRGGRGEGGEI